MAMASYSGSEASRASSIAEGLAEPNRRSPFLGICQGDYGHDVGRTTRKGRAAMPSITGCHHMALTVSDADRSAEWYSSLLNMPVVLSHDGDDVRFRIMAHPESGWMLSVRQYRDWPADGFDELRTGLDHVAFCVASQAELQAWEKELSARGITFTPTAETPIGSVVVFRDPDNIQLEFWLPSELSRGPARGCEAG